MSFKRIAGWLIYFRPQKGNKVCTLKGKYLFLLNVHIVYQNVIFLQTKHNLFRRHSYVLVTKNLVTAFTRIENKAKITK